MGEPPVNYECIFRCGSDPAVLLDIRLIVLDVSDIYCTMVGRSREKMVGEPITNVLFGDDVPGGGNGHRKTLVMDAINETILLKTPRAVPPFRYERGMGDMSVSIFWKGSTLPILESSTRAVKYALLKFENVPDRTADDWVAEFTDRRDIYKLALDNIKDYAIFLLDKEGYIRTWNAGAQRLQQYEAIDILGKNFSIFFPESDRRNGKPQWELNQAIQQGRLEDENWRIRKDGTSFWANVVITPIRDEADGLLGFVKVTRDLTEKRQAEQQMILAYEESAKLKAEFLANMSHEIRTPMNGIVSSANLLRMTPLTSEQQELIDILMESANSMVKLTNDVLDYSKLESDRIYVENQNFNLRSEIERTTATFENMINGPIQMHLVIDGAVPNYTSGDRLRFHQVLANVLDNAVKFTEQGHIRVHVTCDHPADIHVGQSFTLTVSVQDTGIGISEENLQNLFAPFSQLESFATKKYKGTGLGLAICKRLVEMMDGEIHVESQLGKGSIFTFSVKFLWSDQYADALQAHENGESSIAEKVAVQPGGLEIKLKEPGELVILVAEDNRVNQTIVTRVLRKLGYSRIVLASDGKEAVDQYRQHHPDVILMDIQMPVMNGYDATRLIRNENKTVPIIAMTANALKGDAEKCLDAGMNGYIPKPISIPILDKMLRGGM